MCFNAFRHSVLQHSNFVESIFLKDFLLGDKIIQLIIVILLLFCAFFYGGLATRLELSPAKYINKPLSAAETVISAFTIKTCNDNIRWTAPMPEHTGIMKKSDSSKVFYTLYTSTHDTTARLIDQDGTLSHEWSFNFNDVWRDRSHIVSLASLNDSYFYLRDFYLYPNGDIILMVSAGGVTPWGMGLVKLDKDSKVLWKYTGYVNNDFDVGSDGIIYTVEHELRTDQPEKVKEVFLPFLEDHIVMLDHYGNEHKRISLVDAISNSPYASLLNRFEDDGHGDPSHTNSVQYIKKDSTTLPWIRQGHLLISIRNLNSMVVLNPENGEITYAADLPSRMQHDVEHLDNGNLLMFDNRGDISGSDYTRVIELDPQTQQILWERDRDAYGVEMHSDFFGQQTRFENGNTFIVYAEKSQLFEVTPNNEVVWSYTSPLSKSIDGEDRVGIITSAERIPSDFVTFIPKFCGI